MTQIRLTMNCVGSGRVEVRTTDWEKWLQSPLPKTNPQIMKATITATLVRVRMFCTTVVRFKPRQFSSVKTPISAHEANCQPPRLNEYGGVPTGTTTRPGFTAGKIDAREPQNASACA